MLSLLFSSLLFSPLLSSALLFSSLLFLVSSLFLSKGGLVAQDLASRQDIVSKMVLCCCATRGDKLNSLGLPFLCLGSKAEFTSSGARGRWIESEQLDYALTWLRGRSPAQALSTSSEAQISITINRLGGESFGFDVPLMTTVETVTQIIRGTQMNRLLNS